MSPNTPSSDDDLGRELGRQVQRRVRDEPSPAPGFESIQRRAERMVLRRRLAAVAAPVLVVVAGLTVAFVTTDDDPSGVETRGSQPDPTAAVTTTPESTGSPTTPDSPTTSEPSPTDAPSTSGAAHGGDWRPVDELGLHDEPTPILPGWEAPGLALVGVPEDDAVVVAPDGSATRVVTGAPLGRVMVAPDGSILAELTDRPPLSSWRPTATTVVQIRDGGYRVLSPDGSLDGVGMLSGAPVAFVGDLPMFDSEDPVDGGDDTGDLRVVELGSGESRIFVEDAYGIEWTVSEVFVGGTSPDEIVFVDAAGYQPDWRYFDAAGNQLDLASPTDGRYGSDWGNEVDGVGPDVTDAVLSADGSTLYWAEYELGDPAFLTPSAVIHAMDLESGAEAQTFEVSLGRTDVYLNVDLTRADEALVLRRWYFEPDGSGTDRPTHLPPMLVDVDGGTSIDLDLPGADWYHVP